MADIFGTETNKATQAIIDAASKILMGVQDEETAAAQTEDEHPAVTQAEAVDKGARLQMIKKAAENIKKKDDAAAKAAAKRDMKSPGATKGMADVKTEAADLDADNADKAIKHDCATHVVHKEHGEGQCIPGMHTIEETAEGEGYVTHYDVMFDHGVVQDIPVEDLEIVSEMSHGHPRKKK